MHDCDQRSAEWFAARLGKATASRIADITATTKSGPAASRTNYAAQLVAERLTGTPSDTFTNGAMQWGTDTEAEARDAYRLYALCEVKECGFVDHPTVAMSGASPDGLIGDDGLLELKCPNTATHIATLLGKAVPKKYVGQMMWQMACTGRAWCDFASFDPRLPDAMQLFVIRLHRDDTMIAEIEREVPAFLVRSKKPWRNFALNTNQNWRQHNMQTITITGRVGADAETRQAGSNNVTNFNCAVDQGWGDGKLTNWFRVAIWGDRGGKLQQYIKKGDKVAVTGELSIGEYNGKPQYEIRCADIDCFMAGKREADGSQGAPTQERKPVAAAAFETDLDDDVPFATNDPALEYRVG